MTHTHCNVTHFHTSPTRHHSTQLPSQFSAQIQSISGLSLHIQSHWVSFWGCILVILLSTRVSLNECWQEGSIYNHSLSWICNYEHCKLTRREGRARDMQMLGRYIPYVILREESEKLTRNCTKEWCREFFCNSGLLDCELGMLTTTPLDHIQLQ